jgi:transcriptional regulator with XRE-family HTH domain
MSRRVSSVTDVSTRIQQRLLRDPVAHQAYDSQRALVTLGRDLRAARLALGATQAEVAKRAGMTQAELSRLENGLLAKGVTYTTLTQLSHALNHTVVLQPTAAKKRPSSERAIARVHRGARARHAT